MAELGQIAQSIPQHFQAASKHSYIYLFFKIEYTY